MDFQLNDEQIMIRDMIRDFGEREIIPVIQDMEEKHEFPWDILKKMGELGIMGLPIPDEFGGAGTNHLTYITVVEEISRMWASLGVILAVHVSDCAYPLYKLGNEEQKNRMLPPLCSGEKLGAFSLTEPDVGSDASRIKTKAEKTEGGWILNGMKTFVTSGNKADITMLMAVTDPSKGTGGITTFLVEKGSEGLSYGKEERKMGLHSSVITEVNLDNCFVPDENVLGEVGHGLYNALSVLDTSRISIGAQAVGIAQAALDEAVKYSKERKQFGSAINRFQGVSFKLAVMATKVDAARLLVYRAASMVDQGAKKVTKEAAMAKYFSSKIAVDVTREAVQVLGGYGYTTDYPVERFYRDAKVTEIYEGTSEIMKLVISRAL